MTQLKTEKGIGILGGGQLGLMFAQAAVNYGVPVLALSPEKHPIVSRAAQHLSGSYEDTAKLDQLASFSSAITLEFENIPVASVEYLAERVSVRPGARALHVAQDRRLEKRFFRDEAGVPITSFAVIEQFEDLARTKEFDFPAVLKTARDGYDGKGQVKVARWSELEHAWSLLQKVPCVLEAFVHFQTELSVLVARGTAGDMAIYDPFVNEHTDHILSTSWSGLNLPTGVVRKAREIAATVAQQLDYVGLLCIELFQVGDQLIVNEMAPRPHNSGHLTIEAFAASQFDQQVRATLGLPVAPIVAKNPAAMINLIGVEPCVQQTKQILAMPEASWHWYGKERVMPGRKVGHVTLGARSVSQLQEKVAAVRQILAEKD